MCYGRPCTIVRMLRKLRTDGDVIYIVASPGGLPAGEATPSRQSYADCGTGTPGDRLPRRPGSIYTVQIVYPVAVGPTVRGANRP